MPSVRLRTESWSYSSPQVGPSLDIGGCLAYIVPCLDRVQSGCTKHLLDAHMVKLALAMMGDFAELGAPSVTVVTDFAPTWATFSVYVTELNLFPNGGNVRRRKAETWTPGRRSRFMVRVAPRDGREDNVRFPDLKSGLRRTWKDVDGKAVAYYM